MTSPPPQGWKRERASRRERGRCIGRFRIGLYPGRLRCGVGRRSAIVNHNSVNTAGAARRGSTLTAPIVALAGSEKIVGQM